MRHLALGFTIGFFSRNTVSPAQAPGDQAMAAVHAFEACPNLVAGGKLGALTYRCLEPGKAAPAGFYPYPCPAGNLPAITGEGNYSCTDSIVTLRAAQAVNR